MTWLWRISFSGLWLLPVWCASVSGTVVLTDSRDYAVRRHKDFSEVVIWLQAANGARPASKFSVSRRDEAAEQAIPPPRTRGSRGRLGGLPEFRSHLPQCLL